LKITNGSIAVIGSSILVNAFKFVGIDKYIVIEDRREIDKLRDEIEKIFEDKEVTVIVIEDFISPHIKDIIEQFKYKITPIIVELPSPANIKAHDPKEYYKSRARKVLGVSIEV